MAVRLSEDLRLDAVLEGETEQFELADYRDCLVYCINTHATDSGDVTVNDGEAGTEIESITLESDQTGYIDLRSINVDDEDGELEIVTEDETIAVLIRGGARYRPVDQDVDEYEVV